MTNLEEELRRIESIRTFAREIGWKTYIAPSGERQTVEWLLNAWKIHAKNQLK